MQLQVGDKFTDESGEWEVIARPYATAGGKSTHVRIQRMDSPGAIEARTYGSQWGFISVGYTDTAQETVRETLKELW